MNGQKEHMVDEADIGSGEKTPGQEDTEKIIEQISEKAPGSVPNKGGPEQGAERNKEGAKKD